MKKINELKNGDKVYSIKSRKFIEWEIIGKNPGNERFFILMAKESKSIKIIYFEYFLQPFFSPIDFLLLGLLKCTRISFIWIIIKA